MSGEFQNLRDEVTASPGIDPVPAARWLGDHVDGAVPPFAFDLIAGGRSNLTYRVTGADGTRFVLRRPPLGARSSAAHDMAREHRILAALGPTAVPVPPVLGLCDDDSVIGAPFYVMAFVEGAIFDGTEAVAGVPVDVRRRSSEHLIDVLADLHDLDIDRVGLGDLARRSGYIERQLQRWTQQWERCATRELPLIDEVARRLGDSIPAQQRASITHGDFRFGNCLVDVEAGRIAALLDWELCTLGDPLADVGYLGVQWYDGNPRHARRSDPTPAGGFASFDEILARYAARTGRDVGCIDYYVAFSCWRLAVISEGVYGRYRQGAMGDAIDVDLDYFGDSVEVLAGRALGML